MGRYYDNDNNAIQAGENTEFVAIETGQAGSADTLTQISGHNNTVNKSVSYTNITENVTDVMHHAIESGKELAGSALDKLAGVTDKVLGLNAEKDDTIAAMHKDGIEAIREAQESSQSAVKFAVGKMSDAYEVSQKKLLETSETRRIDMNGFIKSGLILGGTFMTLKLLGTLRRAG